MAAAAPLTLSGHYRAAPEPNLPPQMLGGGAYGSVYLYTDSRANRQVAVKRISLNPAAAAALAHFIPRELTIHHSLNHPHVIKLLDVFLTTEQPGAQRVLNLVLERADGNLLSHVNGLLAANNHRMPEGEARWILQQLVATLNYLHAKGVSHRDIKLENALTRAYPALNRPLIKTADFGMSRLGQLAGTIVGTLDYQAPEVMAAGLAGAAAAANPPQYDSFKADIWSAGVLLFATLAGAYPFTSPTSAQRLARMTTRPLDQMPAHLSPEARGLIEAMLDPNPEQRISLEGVKTHPWVQRDLPPGAFDLTPQQINAPSPCEKSLAQLNVIVSDVLEVLQPDGVQQPVAAQQAAVPALV